MQYCLLAGNCIAIQLCQAGLRRQGLYRNTVQSIVTGDKGKRLGCVAIQHNQPRTRRCYARSKARGAKAWRAHKPTIRQPCAATRPAGACDTASWAATTRPMCAPGCACVRLGVLSWARLGVLCTLTQFLTRFDSVLFLNH